MEKNLVGYSDFEAWAKNNGWFYAGGGRHGSNMYHRWISTNGNCVGVAVKYDVTNISEPTGNIAYVEEILAND